MRYLSFIWIVLVVGCTGSNETEERNPEEDIILSPSLGVLDEDPTSQEELDRIIRNSKVDSVSLVILGTCQDAGSPQINCQKKCCEDLHVYPELRRKVVSLGLVDPENEKKYIFEATPDFPHQLRYLEELSDYDRDDVPDGIFLTHAHIGHYTGLMFLGKEAMDAVEVPVFAMPKMKKFLETNGPWSLLVERKNIVISEMNNQNPVAISDEVSVTPFLVPHRDEYSETVGYHIVGPNKSAYFIPDIDKWNKWEKDIVKEIKKVDYAFLDATFYDGEEINNRDISEIPHPFVIESMELFKDLPAEEKEKIIFIHFNHTNPLLNRESEQFQTVIENGFQVAEKEDVYPL